MKTQTELFCGNQFAVIASCLEELLFFRLSKEWSQRSELSSLLEQIQLSRSLGIFPMFPGDIESVLQLTLIGRHVERRFFRALSHKMYSLTDSGSMYQQLQAVRALASLEGDISKQRASEFVCPSSLK
jgi:hypothetical protein